MKAKLTEEDFRQAAEALDCDIPAIKAVSEVESAGGGFLTDGQPKILFEAHVFGKLTGYKYNKSHPTISTRTWNEGKRFYKGGAAEHARLAEAIVLDRVAALQSASWGKFQVLGSNWRVCGFPSLQAFINAMYESEGGHLRAFVGFVKGNHLDSALKSHDWARFARGYNGAGFAANHYDTRMAAAYRKYKAQEPPSIALEEERAFIPPETVEPDDRHTWHAETAEIASREPDKTSVPDSSSELEIATGAQERGASDPLQQPDVAAVAINQQEQPPPVVSNPTSQAIEVVKGNSGMLAKIAGGGSALAAVWTWIGNNPGLTIVLALCATLLILAVVYRSTILKIVEARINADPTKFNVRFVEGKAPKA